MVERVRRQLLIDSRRIGCAKELMAIRDALLVSLMEMTGCRPGEARLALARHRGAVRSEVRDLRAETSREPRALESRLNRMSFERFEEKMWWLQIATFAVVIAMVVAAARLS